MASFPARMARRCRCQELDGCRGWGASRTRWSSPFNQVKQLTQKFSASTEKATRGRKYSRTVGEAANVLEICHRPNCVCRFNCEVRAQHSVLTSKANDYRRRSAADAPGPTRLAARNPNKQWTFRSILGLAPLRTERGACVPRNLYQTHERTVQV